MSKKFLLLTTALTAFFTCNAQPGFIKATDSLVRRTLPAGQANDILLEALPGSSNDSGDSGRDSFEVEQGPGRKIVLRGNSGVALASALYYYLNEYCHFQITWNGTHIDLYPDQRLPGVPVKVQRS